MNKQIALGTVSIAALILAVGIAISQLAGSNEPPVRTPTLWFYNVTNGGLTALPDQLPPAIIDGGEAVRAYVFTCGECQVPDDRIVAYLEMFSTQAKQTMAQAAVSKYENQLDEMTAGTRNSLFGSEGHLVRKPTDAAWVSADSPAGRALRNHTPTCSNGEYAKPCMPN